MGYVIFFYDFLLILIRKSGFFVKIYRINNMIGENVVKGEKWIFHIKNSRIIFTNGS